MSFIEKRKAFFGEKTSTIGPHHIRSTRHRSFSVFVSREPTEEPKKEQNGPNSISYIQNLTNGSINNDEKIVLLVSITLYPQVYKKKDEIKPQPPWFTEKDYQALSTRIKTVS